MSTDQDQARLIAERVARRMSGGRSGPARESSSRASRSNGGNGAPVSEELTAIRSGLADLERKLDRVESKIVQGTAGAPIQSRARVIDFVSSTPPPDGFAVHCFFAAAAARQLRYRNLSLFRQRIRPGSEISAPRPSTSVRSAFGVEEAAVSELVEFFESEKKCSVEPGGKPCDHCAMCSSRGF